MDPTSNALAEPESPALHVGLVRPEIASNTGAVGRTCVAAGAKLWLVRPLGFHITDRHLKRAGLDYWEHLRWEAVDAVDDLLVRIPSPRFWMFTTRGDRMYTEVQYQWGDLLLFGSESQGLPQSWRSRHPECCVRIPQRPEARSLNLSNSVAVAVYEAMRQIGWERIPSARQPRSD